MTDLVERMRADLTGAMRARERDTVRVLRTALAAVANAEALPAEEARSAGLTAGLPADLPADGQSSGAIAGATAGAGSSDLARRVLTEDEVRALVAGERDELVAAGRPQDAAVLAAYL